ncbi:hypothetical protein BC936DRAFT_141868 [Jimgerdemannia flammicorona]|uniref:F-box domain-containing protein n=1 Tax=Jimgerdemannia flammicorona TaxID=994334 RepID=A0A433A1H6_9FUNG|nr:hypothetical protein BC936DRAFT_141868 [Jimgerdemannia flammicorona]
MALFDDIPNEILVRILMNVDDIRNILHCERVCHCFADIVQDDHFKACWLETKFGARKALGSTIFNTLNAGLKIPLNFGQGSNVYQSLELEDAGILS